ncbi:hypothetical protein QOZ80_5AG0375910 [Eleusine coracana subsp. coracana]|nr:hypothetical protein QOZ80_5AG0375910 [Eleusine coracana subsp. coracana]
MNSRPPQHQPGLASSSRPVLDLNVVPVEEPTEINPPAAPAPVRLQPPNLVTTNNVQRLFREFTRRRAGLIRAITTGLKPMHLYGHTDGSWEVSEPELHMAPWHPKMAFGINKVRDNMERVQWLQEIARRCDAWLISVSYFNGAKSMLNADGRELLFNSINGLPTVHEFFMDSDTYHRLCHENEERSRAADDDIIEVDEEEDMDDYEQMKNDDDYKEFENEEDSKEVVDYCKDANSTFCSICDRPYHRNGFWIQCDVCKGWLHGKCGNIKDNQVNHLKYYECPDCCFDKTGHDYD